MFTVHQSVENDDGRGGRRSSPSASSAAPGFPKTAGYYILHEGMIGYLGNDGLQEIKYKKLEDQPSFTPDKTATGWLGITDKYWARGARSRAATSRSSRAS